MNGSLPAPEPSEVIAQVAAITGLAIDEVEVNSQVIGDLDMDSLELVELLVWADEQFANDLTSLLSKNDWNGVTVGDLVEQFHRPS